MKTICCVLKSGGDFEPKHVEWLRRQCAEHMPDWRFQCWSDMDVPDAIALEYDWPKWWSKFQIYRDTIDCKWPALAIDLDTVFIQTLIIRPEHEDKAIAIRDVWRDGTRRPERLGGGFMYLPQWARRKLWSAFTPDVIAKNNGDDQPFLHEALSDIALRFQDHYVDEVVSYKAYVKGVGIQPENKAIYFHGVPRPWHVQADWIPKLTESAEQPQQEIV